MSKRRGTYLGGSTVVLPSGAGFSVGPDFPSQKRERREARPENRTDVSSKRTSEEQAEYDRFKAEKLGGGFTLIKRKKNDLGGPQVRKRSSKKR